LREGAVHQNPGIEKIDISRSSNGERGVIKPRAGERRLKPTFDLGFSPPVLSKK
jgi:hypothetical protein